MQEVVAPTGVHTPWNTLRFLWAPLWIGSNSSVRHLAERLAKERFTTTRDPMQVCLSLSLSLSLYLHYL